MITELLVEMPLKMFLLCLHIYICTQTHIHKQTDTHTRKKNWVSLYFFVFYSVIQNVTKNIYFFHVLKVFQISELCTDNIFPTLQMADSCIIDDSLMAGRLITGIYSILIQFIYFRE